MGLLRSSAGVSDENGRQEWSMVMMAVVKRVISCHGFLSIRYYFVFGIFSFFWILVDGYGRYMIYFILFLN